MIKKPTQCRVGFFMADRCNSVFEALHFFCKDAPLKSCVAKIHIFLWALTAYLANSTGKSINIFLNSRAVNFKNEACVISLAFNAFDRNIR